MVKNVQYRATYTVIQIRKTFITVSKSTEKPLRQLKKKDTLPFSEAGKRATQ
jgi:hypothetical protein